MWEGSSGDHGVTLCPTLPHDAHPVVWQPCPPGAGEVAGHRLLDGPAQNPGVAGHVSGRLHFLIFHTDCDWVLADGRRKTCVHAHVHVCVCDFRDWSLKGQGALPTPPTPFC